MRAVIFDMDGVIVDSELQWMLASREFFRRIMPHWREEDNHKIVGLAVEDLYHWLVEEYQLAFDKAEFLRECHDIAIDVYQKRVTLAPGFLTLLDELDKAKIEIGLASSSPRAWIDFVLNRFSLAGRFAALASADDVPFGKTKPEPDLYLKVLKELQVSGDEALAIEDSARGVRAAKAARCACAALRNGSNDEQDLSAADFELRGFTGATAASLAARVDAKRTSPKI